MDAKQIENSTQEARQARKLSSREDIDPMVQRYRGHIDAIVVEAVVVVEASRAVAMSTSLATQGAYTS